MSAFREPNICGMCQDFNAGAAVESDGNADCSLRGRQRWSDHACVNYNRVRNWYQDRSLDVRKRWIIKLIELHPAKDAA